MTWYRFPTFYIRPAPMLDAKRFAAHKFAVRQSPNDESTVNLSHWRQMSREQRAELRTIAAQNGGKITNAEPCGDLSDRYKFACVLDEHHESDHESEGGIKWGRG